MAFAVAMEIIRSSTTYYAPVKSRYTFVTSAGGGQGTIPGATNTKVAYAGCGGATILGSLDLNQGETVVINIGAPYNGASNVTCNGSQMSASSPYKMQDNYTVIEGGVPSFSQNTSNIKNARAFQGGIGPSSHNGSSDLLLMGGAPGTAPTQAPYSLTGAPAPYWNDISIMGTGDMVYCLSGGIAYVIPNTATSGVCFILYAVPY